jgi:hypothetical protein
MTAQPAEDYDPDDPVEALRVLPARFHEQFLAEYVLLPRAPGGQRSTASCIACCGCGS